MSDPELPDLPKIDLHMHLDGALRPQTILELARLAGSPLPATTAEALEPHVQVPPSCRSLTEFLHTFEVFYPVLRGPEAVERMTYEAVLDSAASGCIYVEGRFAPVLQAAPGFPILDVVDAALRGLHAALAETGIDGGLILCCYRSESAMSSIETVAAAEARLGQGSGCGVLGIDLAGDEINYPAAPHVPAFKQAQAAGLPITAHAGECGTAANIREAIDDLGATRLGHGLKLIDDDELTARVRDLGIVLETSLTSNLQTMSVPGIAEHPFGRWLAEGLNVTLNTDDPRVSSIDINHEFALARDSFGLSHADLHLCVTNAARGAFCDDSTRAGLLARLDSSWSS